MTRAEQTWIPEIWKPIPGWESLYEISDLGRVRSIARKGGLNRSYGGREVTTIRGSHGYAVVNLTRRGKRQQLLVHLAVLRAFIGEPALGQEACHKDGNRMNAALNNLRWDTKKANHADKKLHGTWQGGEVNGSAKLTNAMVRDIRDRKLRPMEVVRQYGISHTHATRIVKRQSWKHV